MSVHVLFVVALEALASNPIAVVSPTNGGVTAETRDILHAEQYEFCNDEKHVLWPWERDYCPLLGNKNTVCPAFPKVCENEINLTGAKPKTGSRMGRTDQGEGQGDGTGTGSGSGDGDGDGKGKDKGKHEEKKPPPEPKKIEVPSFLATLFQVLFFVLAAAFIGFIVWIIARNLLKGREAKDAQPKTEGEAAPTDEAPRVNTIVEKDVDRLLARAREHAARGDFKAAIDDAYAALLRRLEGDGIIEMHWSRTNGDYVRQIRDKDDLRRAVGDIVNDVERTQFGTEPPQASLFESVYRRVLPLVGRAAMLLLLLLSLGPLVSCDSTKKLGVSREGGNGPLGLSAVATLLARQEHDVEFRKKAPSPEQLREQVVVLLPSTPLDDTAWRRLLKWVRDDGGVVVLAGHRPEAEREFGVQLERASSNEPLAPSAGSPYAQGATNIVLPTLGKLRFDQPGAARSGTKRVPSTQSIVPVLQRASTARLPIHQLDETSSATDPAYYGVLISGTPVGKGRVLVFADDRWFANGALPIADNAFFIARLFHDLGREDVEIWSWADEESGGGGADSHMESLANAHLLPIVLQVFALVLLFIFHRGVRFGTPVEPKTFSRRAFADHARALGTTYARAKATHHANGVFAVWALDRLRERFQGTGRRGIAPLAEAIAMRTGQPMSEVMATLVEASGVRDDVAPPSSYRPGSVPPPRAKSEGEATDFKIMQELDRYLNAAKSQGAPKSPDGGKDKP